MKITKGDVIAAGIIIAILCGAALVVFYIVTSPTFQEMIEYNREARLYSEDWECVEWQCLGGSCTLEEIEAYYANAPTGYNMKYEDSIVYDCYPLEINETGGGGGICEPRDCTKQIKIRVRT